MTQAAVSRIERGQATPTWETLRALLLAMGYEPELRVRRLEGRWDPVHLRASRERPPAERLELAISARHGALDVLHDAPGAGPYHELRERALKIRLGELELAVVSRDDLISMKRASARPVDLEDIAALTEPDE
jgi:transcriptional regulator with XRE-family HTH domain